MSASTPARERERALHDLRQWLLPSTAEILGILGDDWVEPESLKRKTLIRELIGWNDSGRPEDAEMTCERCGRYHGLVWSAPSDVWNETMREGIRANVDRYGFCCPNCFMALSDDLAGERRIWIVGPQFDSRTEPVRVEEPAGERVAQSANADVRAWIDTKLANVIADAEAIAAGCLDGTSIHALASGALVTDLRDARNALARIAPDETEAIRAVRALHRDGVTWEEYAGMLERVVSAQRMNLDEALACVAGLEAREARLRGELRLREESQIPVVPHAAQEKIERLEAREASLRELVDAARAVLDYEHTPRRAALSDLRAALDALADSDEAGS